MTSAAKKPTKQAKLVCPNLGIYHIVNTRTGELVQLPCKRYSCPSCGPKKAYKLKKALINKFECFDYVRMFTFTFRTSIFANPQHCINRSSEIWRRFINNVRRDKTLHKSLRNFQYVRLIEFTKRGYPHYHVLVDRYLPVQILANHWRHAINVVCRNSGYNGSVNAKGIKTAKNAAAYVVKYVLKTANEFDINIGKYFEHKRCKLKLYTKSALMKLFFPSSSIDKWEFIILWELATAQNLINKPIAQLPEDFLLFSSDLPPPSDKYIEMMEREAQNDYLRSQQFEISYNNYINN